MSIYLGDGLYAETSVRDSRNQTISQVKTGDVCVHLVTIDVGSMRLALDLGVHSTLPMGVNRVSFKHSPSDEWYRKLNNVTAGKWPAWCQADIGAGPFSTDEIMQCDKVEFRDSARQTPWQACGQGLPLNVPIKVL